MEGKDWIAIVGIAGTLLGTFLGSRQQNVYATEQERAKTIEARQSEAFLSLLNALDKGRLAEQRKIEGKNDESIKLKESFELEAGAAFRKIGVFGDKEVAEATAIWSQQDRKLPKCQPWWNADLNTWKAMREISRGESQRISREALIVLTLFCDPETAK